METKDRLNKVIEELGVQKKELAKKCNISEVQLFNYLNGANEPSTKFLKNLKKLYPMIQIDWLLTGIGEPFNQTPGARYKDLREVLKLTYEGKNKDKIFSILDRDDYSLFEKTIFLSTILTFLDKASKNESYYKMLMRFASYINEENVGFECEESRALIMSNLTDMNRLFELAQHGFEYDQPGLVFYFTQIFEFLELWEFDPKSMKLRIKLFNEEFVTYDPFTIEGKEDFEE